MKETKFYDSAVDKFKHRDFNSALQLFLRSIEEDPENFKAYNYAGIIFGMADSTERASKYFDKAIELKPEFSDAYSNKGIVLSGQGRYEEALSFFQKAKSIAPANEMNYYNHAVALQEIGKIHEAICEFRKTIMINKNNAQAHFHLALLLLMTGDFKEGWAEYEWGYKSGDILDRKIYKPRWDGSNFAGKKLYIYSDQGFGDTFQFIRFLPEVKKRGGEIILEVEPQVKEIAERFGYFDKLVVGNKERRPAADFDIYIPLLSIPGTVGTNISGDPYLSASPEKIEEWKEIINSSGKLKAGFVWTGNIYPPRNKKRHMNLTDFASLFDIKGVEWYSLQKDAGTDFSGYPVTDMGLKLNDFNDTAAAVSNLDLVISIDTSVAHIAGAMGKKCWLLLANVPDWRWGISGENSAWYNSVKCFRQTERGNWKDMIKNVKSELLKLAEDFNE